jgi:hypothetical protein
MFNMKTKSIVVLTSAALAITGLGITPGQAASTSKPLAATAHPAAAPITDFSSRRYYRGRNNAAALGAFAAIAGTVAAVAIARRHRHGYGYYPYGGPAYGYAQPYGYGAPYGYYGPRYYRGW